MALAELSPDTPRRSRSSQTANAGFSDQDARIVPFSPAASGVFDPFALPGWLEVVQARIRALQSLRPNWDTYDANPINSSTASYALNVLSRVTTGRTPEPHIVPMSGGGLQFEWRVNGVNLEAAFYQPLDLEVSFVGPDGREQEFSLRDNVEALRLLMKRTFG